MFANVVKELSSRHVLHNHEEVCGGADHLVPTTHTCVSGLFNIHLWTFTIIRNIKVQTHWLRRRVYAHFKLSKQQLTAGMSAVKPLRDFRWHLNSCWEVIHLCFMVRILLKHPDSCSRNISSGDRDAHELGTDGYRQWFTQKAQQWHFRSDFQSKI